MLSYEPFVFEDLADLNVQERHREIMREFIGEPSTYRPLMETKWAYTAWTECGRPIASAGVMECGVCWAFFSQDMRKYMLPVTRKAEEIVVQFAAETGMDPVMQVDNSFPEAVRWARALGFEPVGLGNVWVRNASSLRSRNSEDD